MTGIQSITDVATIISATASAITVIIACIAVIYSYKATRAAQRATELSSNQLEYDRKARVMDIHSRFQSHVRELQKNLPNEVNDKNWQPSASDQRIITLYWYLVFDEWFTCTKGGAELQTLWDEVYAEGVRAALRLPAFETKIIELFHGDSTFLGLGREFYGVINELYWNSHSWGRRSGLQK